MNYKKSLEVVKAIEIIAEYLGLEVEMVAGRVCFCDDAAEVKINKAITERNKFVGMSFDERAEAFGFTVKTERSGEKSITVEL